MPKSEEDKQSILRIISDCVILKHLDADQKESVAAAMEKVQQPAGTEIIRQGADGDFFYIIESGTVDVFVRSGDQEHPGNKVCSYVSGDAFGELAIMYNAPRAATCVATSDVALWALDRQSFRAICMTMATSKRTLHRSFLQHVHILSSLNEREILTIADALVEEEFKDGEEICTQGESGNKFYLVKKVRTRLSASVVARRIQVAIDGKTLCGRAIGGFFRAKRFATSLTLRGPR